MKVSVGPIVIDTSDTFEKNQVHVGVDRETWADPNFTDFQACVAALNIAAKLPASEIVVERIGCRSRVYTVAEVKAHLRRHPEQSMGNNGLGNVEDPKYGINIAPGHYIPIDRLRRKKAQAVAPTERRIILAA